MQSNGKQQVGKGNKRKGSNNRVSITEELDLEEIDDRIEALKESYNELIESQNMIFQFKIVSIQFIPLLVSQL